MTHSHQELYLLIAEKKYAVTRFYCKNDALSLNYQGEVSFTSSKSLEHSPGEKLCLIIKNKRYLHGMVSTWISYGKKRDLYAYKIRFFSLIQALDQINNHNYVHQSIEDVLQTLLQRNKIHAYELRLTKTYPCIQFLAQYQKKDLTILEKLLKEYRLFYTWVQKDKNALLHLSDDKNTLQAIFKGCLLSYKPFNTGIDNEDVVFEKSYSKSIDGSEFYRFKTNCCTLYPGQIIHLSTQETTYNRSFRIINIEHLGKQLSDQIEAEQRELVYQNNLTCISFSNDFIKNPKKQRILKTLTAQTTEQHTNTLDDQGHYYLNFSYDPNTTTPAFKRIQDFNGNSIAGWHFPLKNHALVLMGFIEDNINTPIMLGHIPTSEWPSPVTQKNACQYIIRTQQSECIIDDKLKSILLKNKTNKIHLYQQGIDINSAQGELHIKSIKNYSINAGLNYTIQAKKNYKQIFHQASFLTTKQGNIEIKASDNLKMLAKESISLQSKTVRIQAKNKLNILANNQYLKIGDSISLTASEFLSQAADKIKVCATKHMNINATISLAPNYLKITTESLDINADEIQVYQDSQIN